MAKGMNNKICNAAFATEKLYITCIYISALDRSCGPLIKFVWLYKLRVYSIKRCDLNNHKNPRSMLPLLPLILFPPS